MSCSNADKIQYKRKIKKYCTGKSVSNSRKRQYRKIYKKKKILFFHCVLEKVEKFIEKSKNLGLQGKFNTFPNKPWILQVLLGKVLQVF